VTFTTPQFVLFFLLFFWIWVALRGRSQARKAVLLAASYLFYGSWNAKFLLLILASTLVDFYVGRLIGAAEDQVKRKRLMWVSVGLNLGFLGFFKYYDFFIESAVAGLAALGIQAHAPTLGILLPVGISFYTFQTMSYTIDIYRRQMEPTKSLFDFALYVAYFPQLVAGPIERAGHLLPQIAGIGHRAVDWSGFGLIALGCFKKVVIADNVAELTELTYADPGNTYGLALWVGTWAFAVQIYCDFSGYSDIAVGLSRLFGIELIQNFKAPYASAGPSEFWRRWHISLSTWLRDYLYIPLGGNRGSTWFTGRNLVITMLLGGLWHGAAGNYILWGAWQGLLLLAFRPEWMRRLVERWDAKRWSRLSTRFVRKLVFFQLVCLGWALFRAKSFEDCVALWRGLLDVSSWDWTAFTTGIVESGAGGQLAVMMALVVLTIATQMIWSGGANAIVARLWRMPEPVRFAVVVALLYACVIAAPEAPPPFIYFQF
jgi:alginate O-acetyltransferase complex protein AlgI